MKRLDKHESAARRGLPSARAGTPVVSSEPATVAVIRGCRRVNPESPRKASARLAELDLIPLSGAVVDEAAEMGRTLRTGLDTTHLALSIRPDISAFIANNHHLANATSAASPDSAPPGT